MISEHDGRFGGAFSGHRQATSTAEGGPLFAVGTLLWRRKGLIAAGLFAGLALASLYGSRAGRIYEANVEILIVQKDSNLPARGVERERAEESTAMNDLLATHVQLFRSPLVIHRAVETRRLEKLPSLLAASQSPRFPGPIEHILENLTVKKGGEGQGKEARVLRAAYRGPSAEDCKVVLDALVESYQRTLGETFQDTSEAAIKLMAEAKQELEDELSRAEEAYRRFREDAPLLTVGDDQTAASHYERLRKIDAALAEVQVQETEARTRLAIVAEALQQGRAKTFKDLERLALIGAKEMQRIALMVAAVRGDANASEVFQSKQPLRTTMAAAEFGELLNLTLRERAMLEDFGPKHPEIAKIRQQIETARDFLSQKGLADPLAKHDFSAADLLAAQMTFLEHDLAELERRQKELRELARQENNTAKKVVLAGIQDQSLRADLLRKRQLHDVLIERLKTINLINEYGGILARVIAPVQTPVQPVWPLSRLILAVGGLLGLCAGAGMAYSVELLDRTFRTSMEICESLRLPLLGELPPLRARQTARSMVNRGPAQMDPRLVAYHNPLSDEAETIRRLRAMLCVVGRRHGHKIVQITGPNAGDGKTMLASNLAVSLAQSGKKVLLIDADFRRPTIGAMFAVVSSAGLSEVIQGKADLLETVTSGPIEGLAVLPAGADPTPSSEPWTSPAFEQLLATVREAYDYVLLDSPPVLPFSDSMEIASRVDGVLFVTRIRRNGAPAAFQAKEMLTAVSAPIFGVVVNEFKMARAYRNGSFSRHGWKHGAIGADGRQGLDGKQNGKAAATGNGRIHGWIGVQRQAIGQQERTL